jgi:hypothetical protein
MEGKTKEIIKVAQENEVSTFIQQAIQNNLPVETMERLFALREKVKDEQAREAFVTAMSDFQKDCPKIEKTKKVMNKDGQSVRYQFAPLDVIVSQIKKVVADNGFSYGWDVKNEPGFITAICTITHKLGHFKTSEFKIPIDTEGYMTAPQKYASALTFAKRYSLVNGFGISTGDEDTDATDVGKEAEAKSVKSKILFLLKTLGENGKEKADIEKAILKLAKLELKAENYQEIKSRLEVLVNKKQGDDSKIQ